MANSIAVQDKAGSLVRNLEASFATALPNHVTKEHFARALQTMFRKNPKLQECTPDSIGSSVLMAASLGLNLGVGGAGWLIPYGKECTLIIGYQGKVDLCYRSDRVESIACDIVCENDFFEYQQGTEPFLKHVPALKGGRGKMYATYACAKIKGGGMPFVVLDKDEVMKIKAASPGAKKSDSPWNGSFEGEMWKKSSLHRLTKVLPKNTELARVLEFENQQAQRIHDIEATVVSDPLAPGRHTRKKKDAPVTKDIAPDDSQEAVSVDLEYVRGAEKSGFSEAVAECLQGIGFSSLEEIENRPEQLAEVAKNLKELLKES